MRTSAYQFAWRPRQTVFHAGGGAVPPRLLAKRSLPATLGELHAMERAAETPRSNNDLALSRVRIAHTELLLGSGRDILVGVREAVLTQELA